MAKAHSEPLSRRADVEIAAYCDVDRKRARLLARQFNAPVFKRPAEMFDAVPLDAVYICLPPFAHGGPGSTAGPARPRTSGIETRQACWT